VHAAPSALATVASRLTPIPPVPSLPEPRSLSGADIATILERRVVYDAWIESIEQAASRLLEIGGSVPGWGLRSRSGHRKFKDTEAALKELKSAGGLTDVQLMTEPKLRSPAQIEKILSPSKKKLLEPLVERPQGAPQLVRLTGNEVAQAATTVALQAIPQEARA
jgi:hypothetical protein